MNDKVRVGVVWSEEKKRWHQWTVAKHVPQEPLPAGSDT